ncbi:MAG: VWA-like domain-containing protein [Victivallaceae bacterium]|nr:VWA-like domain-containing protein [Victivallaceae bacterium]
MSKVKNVPVRRPTEAEERLKNEVAQLMIRDRVRLLERQPFIGHLAMRLAMKPVIDCRMNAASTDGTRLFVDAEFYKKMDAEERLGVLAHEVWHCALRHFARLGDRDRKKFNYATDVEVDLLLYNAGFKVEILPYDKSWIGMSAELIYNQIVPAMTAFQKPDLHLYQEDQPKESLPSPSEEKGEPQPGDEGEAEQPGNGEPQSGDDGNGTENGESEAVSGESKESGGESSGEPSGNGEGQQSNGSSGGSGGTDGKKDGLNTRLPRVSHSGVFDPDFDPGFSEDIAEEWKENLKDAVRKQSQKGGRGIGNLPGNVEDLIREDEKEATVDWKKVLLDYVSQIFGGDRQWLPPARRYVWKKLYLPSRARKKTIEIVLAIDTSGSTAEDLPDFLAELRGMVASFGDYKLTIIQCDMTIHAVKEYSNDDPLSEEGLKFHGFGGTSFLPPFQYVERKMPEPPTVFIYLTDGFGEAPEKVPDYPVIWCLTNSGEKPAKWGLEVKIAKK